MAPESSYNVFAADLQANLPTLRSSSEFSDFTITCDGSTYKVHKFLLSTHSGFFATMFRSGFKEAQENTMNLEGVESWIVDAMMEALYNGDYTYDHDDVSESEALFHAKVYAIAEMYDIQQLKNLACDHFTRTFAIGADLELNDLADTIEYIYKSTPEADRRLRDIVVHIAADRASEFYRCPEFTEMAGSVNDFCNDLAQRLGVNQDLLKEVKVPLLPISCETCGNAFNSSKRGGGGALFCPCCGRIQTE